MTNVNVILALDTRRKKKDGTYPIILRLSSDERTLSIPTKYSVAQNDWDAKKREVKNSYKGLTSVARLNNILAAQKKEARDIILKLQSVNTICLPCLNKLNDEVDTTISKQAFSIFEGIRKHFTYLSFTQNENLETPKDPYPIQVDKNLNITITST